MKGARPMPDKLIFAQTFEGLFRAVSARLDERLSEALRQLGVDPNAELKPAYPLAVFLATVKLLGHELFPEAPEEERQYQLGCLFMDGYRQTMVGRAMVGMMRIIGPRRTLERLSRQFRTGNNFSETKVEDLGPNECRLWCNQVTVPGWYRGLVTKGLEFSGATNVQISLIAHDAAGGTFHIRWSSGS